jgi:DNA-binding transcriptional regulator GbsR (MarR family)
MTTEERIKKQKELIEEIGRYFDKEGFQPIAGRVLGLLMVMDKEQYTFDEITEELQISKSSASNVLRNLEIRGDIEYVTLPGDRKRYFQLKTREAFNLLEGYRTKSLKAIKLFSYIIELKADKDSKNAIFMKQMMDMLNYLVENLEIVKEQYLKNAKK